SVVEGNLGTTNAVFTVTLSAVSGQTVTVVANSANGTATTPSDYTAIPPTTVTFAPGETSKTVTVAVNGDMRAEANATFFVNLTAADNVTFADHQGLGTTSNDELFPYTTLIRFSVVEGNLGTTNAVFTVTLSAVSGQTVTVVANSA